MNIRLMQQYHSMIYMIWFGITFADDALIRFERLQKVYCWKFNRTPLNPSIYSAAA